MDKTRGRVLWGTFVLVLLTASGFLAFASCKPRTTQAYQISPDRAAKFTFAGGAQLSAPPGAFDRDTSITARRVESPELPRKTPAGVLVSGVYEMSFAGGAADFRKPVTLTLPYDPQSVPEGAPPHALKLARWDGEDWQKMPSTADAEKRTVSAELLHFSRFGVVWSRFEDLVYDATGSIRSALYDSTHVHDVFNIHYQDKPRTSSGVGTRFNINPKLETIDERPPQKDDDRDGVPDYIERLGEALAYSRKVFEGGGPFRGMRLPVSDAIHVFVVDTGYEQAKGGGGPLGDVHNITTHIRIDNSLNDSQLQVTAAHELFHYWQWSTLPILTGNKHTWWLEATSTWAMAQVHPQNELYYEMIRASKPNPPLLGYADLPGRATGEFYAAGSLAFYLEQRFPGFIMATFDRTEGLGLGEPWHDTFDRLLRGRYPQSLGLTSVFLDYMAAYYYHHDIHQSMDSSWGFGGVYYTTLAQPPETVKPGSRVRIQAHVPPLSGRLISLVAGSGDLKKGTLVAQQRQANPYDQLRTLVFAARRVGGEAYRFRFPGDSERLGLDVENAALAAGRSALDPLPFTGFGGVRSDAPVTEVHAIFVNEAAYQGFDIDLEAYLLLAPENVRSQPAEKQTVRISWDASPLPRELLRGYVVYAYGPGGAGSPVATAGPGTTEVEIATGSLRERTSLVVRVVDQNGFESPDSDPVRLTLPTPTPTRTATPAPKAKPSPTATATPRATPTPAKTPAPAPQLLAVNAQFQGQFQIGDRQQEWKVTVTGTWGYDHTNPNFALSYQEFSLEKRLENLMKGTSLTVTGSGEGLFPTGSQLGACRAGATLRMLGPEPAPIRFAFQGTEIFGLTGSGKAITPKVSLTGTWEPLRPYTEIDRERDLGVSGAGWYKRIDSFPECTGSITGSLTITPGSAAGRLGGFNRLFDWNGELGSLRAIPGQGFPTYDQ